MQVETMWKRGGERGYGGTMEGIEAQEVKRPWNGLGAWMGGAPGRPLSWAEAVSPERAGDRSGVERNPEGLGMGPLSGEARGAEAPHAGPAGVAGLIHDVRNMVTAMELYCDLLDQPGVLTESCRHYAGELRMVSAASRRLLDRLGMLESGARQKEGGSGPRLVYSASPLAAAAGDSGMAIAAGAAGRVGEPETEAPILARPGRMQAFSGGEPVANLADELKVNRGLLAAVAGQGVTVELAITGGYAPVEMTREDLTRVLVNLTRNASEAMASSGRLEIALGEVEDRLSLSFSDTGSGIAPDAVSRIFLPGYTTHIPQAAESAEGRNTGSGNTGSLNGPIAEGDRWPVQHRGLGLAIVRSLVTAARGSVWAANREDCRGAVFTVEFPLRQPRGAGMRRPG
ncbi:MAG TPA: ATP-binding protein [Acidobacteriaceae bacterium]|nr:ATP-binding protein [Acidobacteriaceae bacterium]